MMKTVDYNQDLGLGNSFKSKQQYYCYNLLGEKNALMHIETSYENAQLQLANDTLIMTNKTPFF